MPDLTPLVVERTGDHLTFKLRDQEEILLQLPDDYEVVLAQRLAGLLSEEDASLTAEISLDGLIGISSRQLGSLIALGKVLRPRFGTVPVTHVSAGVRRLLALTRTDRLFALDA
jgi:hypothetical protein